MKMLQRLPIHSGVRQLYRVDINQLYSVAPAIPTARFQDAIDRTVLATQLWDLLEQRHPELAAEHRANVEVALALKGKG